MNKRAIVIIVGVVVVLLGGLLAYAAMNTGKDTADNVPTSNTDNDTVNEEQPVEDMDMSAQESQSPGSGETDQSNQSNASSQETSAVTISGFAFGPKQVTVKVGTTVTWTNQDGVKHDVKMENGSTDGPSSELLGKGESYSYTFKKVGVYNYLCTPHPYMKGTVTVTE